MSKCVSGLVSPNPKKTLTLTLTLTLTSLTHSSLTHHQAVNVLEHREEIYGRPARSWFQSNDEKEASAKRSKHEGPTAARSEAPVVEVPTPQPQP